MLDLTNDRRSHRPRLSPLSIHEVLLAKNARAVTHTNGQMASSKEEKSKREMPKR